MDRGSLRADSLTSLAWLRLDLDGVEERAEKLLRVEVKFFDSKISL